MKYIVTVSVDGTVPIEVEASSVGEARRIAEAEFCDKYYVDEDFGSLDVVGWFAAQVEGVDDVTSHVDPITRERIGKYDHERDAVLRNLTSIRKYCDVLESAFRNISDKANPKCVAAISEEIRRAEVALTLANNNRWRN